MWGKNASPLKIRRFNSCFFEYQKGVDPLEINDFEGIECISAAIPGKP